MAGVTLVLLSLFFAPFYIRTKVATLPDFLEQRYDRTSRDWLAGISIASAILVHIGYSLVAGGIVIEGMFGIPRTVSNPLESPLGLLTILRSKGLRGRDQGKQLCPCMAGILINSFGVRDIPRYQPFSRNGSRIGDRS